MDDTECVKILKKIIQKLTVGEKYYFEFMREEDDFLSFKEIEKYRIEIPKYFEQNGKYEIKSKLDESRFKTIACIPLYENVYDKIILFWKYFYGMMFFTPN
ncbi:hypothetical protein RBH29_17590, partial [Herbivorax sp. ANBcel31]|uniref:hypothetical protein n=1 Tax=Herbivorax sp. ANBcel31 TaxID=3069754 RepID=UPI0027B16182